MACRFCNIDDMKTRIVFEGRHCFVALSNPRLMPGHLLVIPKRHVEKLSDLDPRECIEIFDTLSKYCDKVLKISKGYSIHQNYMPMIAESRTKVDHLHIHIWPRELDDELYMKSLKHQHDLFTDLADKELNKYLTLFTS